MSKQRVLIALASMLSAAACSDGVGPSGRDFDAQSVQSGLSVV
jgi:hypothetical protein